MKISRRIAQILSIFLLVGWASWAFAAKPIILYSDLVSGPKVGGQDNKGAFVSIWGKDFGSARGTSYVALNGGKADNYPVWTDNKIIFQLGSNPTTGDIKVTTADGTSNGVPFTINNTMAIKFVDGDGKSGGSGTYEEPYTSPSDFINYLEGRENYNGAICYFRAGTYTHANGETTWNESNFMLTNDHKGSPNSYVAYIAYPGESITISNTRNDDNFQLGKMSSGTSADYTIISSFTLSVTAGEAVFGGGTDRSNEQGAKYVRVVGCDINGNYGKKNTMTGLVEVSGDNNYILGNDFENNASSPIKNNHGVYIQGGADNVYVGYNHFHDMKLGHVIQVHADGGSSLVYQNVHIFSNLIEANNRNDCRGINVGLVKSSSYGYIYNNVLNNVGQDFSGICIYCGNWEIYNNTLYHIKADEGILVSSSEYGQVGTRTWRNNIIVSSDSSPYFGEWGSGTHLGTVEANCYYGNGIGPGTAYNGHVVSDSTAINGDPKFVSAGSDFHLTSASPCVDAGTSSVNGIVKKDFDGIVRPQATGFDIGAYEYDTGSPPPLPLSPPPTPGGLHVEP